MNTPKIELIYDTDCPNINAARTQLVRAIKETGINLPWQEWNSKDENAPIYARNYGSPTILVNEHDVVKSENPDAGCCRIYTDDAGTMRGVPSVEQIVSALPTAADKTT